MKARSAPSIKFAAVRVETSFVALYVGQSLMPELLELLIAHGLELWFVEPGFVDPASGRLLQLDATFFRPRPGVSRIGANGSRAPHRGRLDP